MKGETVRDRKMQALRKQRAREMGEGRESTKQEEEEDGRETGVTPSRREGHCSPTTL